MTILRHALLIGAPLAFSVLLWFHPMLSDYEGLWDVTARFQAVHIGMVLALPLLAVAIYGLLAGLRGRAAAVGRVALIPFVTFYVPYVAFEGIAVGVLGDRSTTSRPASATRSARAWSRISHETPSSASPHAPPLAPIGWACFAAAGWMVLRSDRAPG